MFKILVFLTFVCTIFDVNAQMLSAGDVDKTRVFETKKEDVVIGSVKEEVENTGLTLEELTRQNASSNNDMAQALSDAVVSTESSDKKVVA